MVITHYDVVRDIAENTGLPQTDIKLVLKQLAKTVEYALTNGVEIPLNGIGKLCVRRHQARKSVNPRTGESILVPSKNKVFLKVTKNLADVV